MAVMDEALAIERITETEKLTDGLDDDANWLLQWGTSRVGGLIAGIADEEAAGVILVQTATSWHKDLHRMLGFVVGKHHTIRSSRQGDSKRHDHSLGTAVGDSPDSDLAGGCFLLAFSFAGSYMRTS